jgi:hypothetical protein
MSDTVAAAIIGAAVGAVVGGLVSFLVQVPQLHLLRIQAATATKQLQMPILLPAVEAVSPLFLRRYVTEPPDEATLNELSDNWNRASEPLYMMLRGGRAHELNALIRGYLDKLRAARHGKVSPEELDGARLTVRARFNATVGSPET